MEDKRSTFESFGVRDGFTDVLLRALASGDADGPAGAFVSESVLASGKADGPAGASSSGRNFFSGRGSFSFFFLLSRFPSLLQ